MPRLPGDFRISVKRRRRKTHRTELVRNQFNQQFWVRRNGKQPAKLPDAHVDQAVHAADHVGQDPQANAVPPTSITPLATPPPPPFPRQSAGGHARAMVPIMSTPIDTTIDTTRVAVRVHVDLHQHADNAACSIHRHKAVVPKNRKSP